MAVKGDLATALAQAMSEETDVERDEGALVQRMFELAGTDTCFVKAAAEEPIFVLRARDALAPHVVRFWADHAEMFSTLNQATQGKVDEARAQAMRMEAWQREHGCKVPD